MSSAEIACTECRTKLPADFANAGEFLGCPSCGQLLRIFVFPALHRAQAEAAAAAAVVESGEASCFYHPQKRALVSCDNCGRFLCALCDVEIGAAHRCPNCLEAERRQGKTGTMENRRVLFDGIALALATVPILIWPFTLLSAPAAIFFVIRYWRKPLSILPRTRIRFLFALLLALAQIGGWVMLFYYWFAQARKA